MKTSNYRRITLLILVIALVLSCSLVFVACGEKATGDNGSSSEQSQITYYVTIHQNNGEADIRWSTNDAIPTITKEGYVIEGIYLDAEYNTAVSLESLKLTGLNKDLEVYVKWTQEECKHTVIVTDAGRKATCTETGLTDGSHCATCNAVIVAQKVIPALGHDIIHHDGKAPTCTEYGWEEYNTCSRCDYTTYTQKNATGHIFEEDWTTDETYHWHKSTCGHSVISGQAEHAFDDNGICTVCGYKDTKAHGTELYSTVLEVNGNNIFTKVSNDTEYYYLSSDVIEIAKDEGAKYGVYSDISCTTEIKSKMVAVNNIGDNRYYILVENGSDSSLYFVNIRRKPIYTVSFSTLGTEVKSQKVEEDSLATEPTSTRVGYNLKSWDYDFATPITKDTLITASWEAIKYNITYDLAIESYSVSKDVDNSENPTTYTIEDRVLFNTITRKGYQFEGWDTELIDYGTIGDKTITASWVAIGYAITYKYGDETSVSKGSNNIENPEYYVIEDSITFKAPTRVGYTFVKWDIGSISVGEIGNKTITAIWTVNNYTLTYKYNDEISVSKGTNNKDNPATYTIEEDITFKAPSRSGYTFIAWDDESIVAGEIGDKTITASWNIVEYSISYDLGDGTSEIKATNDANNPVKYTVEDAISLKAPTRECYTFIKWDKTISKGTTGNIIVTASWDAIKYNITYVLKGGTNSTENAATFTVEQLPYTLNNATIDGYIFNGWRTKDDYNSSAITSIDKIGDITVYAMFAGTVGLRYTLNTSDKNNPHYVVSGYSGSSDDVVVPDKCNGIAVTVIGDGAFRNDYNIKSVILPNGVKYIDFEAFEGCDNLISINIPNSVIEISQDAFNECDKLIYNLYGNICYLGNTTNPYLVLVKPVDKTITECTIHDNTKIIYSNSDKDDSYNYIFSGCDELTTVNWNAINSKLNENNSPFEACAKLITVNFGEDVQMIPSFALCGCNGIQSITIPSSVISIGEYAFDGCIGLKNLIIGDSVTTIGDYAFGECRGLTNIVFPESLISIGAEAFVMCEGLTSITIPKNMTSDIELSFAVCTNLASIIVDSENTRYHSVENCLIETATKTLILGCKNSVIPEDGSVTSIYFGAFCYCIGLTSITIPNSVTSIEESVFEGCYKLVEVYNKSSLKITAGSEDNGYVGYYAKAIYTSDYTSKVTNDNGYIIYDGTILLGYTGTETELEIPSYITEINQVAFYNCTGLTSIEIPNSVTSIGDYAFEGCSSLAYNEYDNAYYLGNSTNPYVVLIKVKDTSITACTINKNTKVIYHDAFSGCSGITSIEIPNSVTNIGDCAFYMCSGLTSIEIPNGVTSIGYRAFYGCDGLTSITVDGANTVYQSAGSCLIEISTKTLILGCNNSVIPTDGSVVIIGEEAFYGCSGLITIEIPNSVITIEEEAFAHCTGLTSITIGSGVTNIGDWAFNGCTSLTFNEYENAYYLGNSENPYLVLYKVKDLESTSCTINESTKIIHSNAFQFSQINSIDIPDSVIEIGSWAFIDCDNLTSIIIGSGVIRIGTQAFEYCDKLINLTVRSGNALYHSAGNCLIETALKTLVFGCKGSIIPSDGSVTTIGEAAFSNCSGLTSITIPNSITSIGGCVFSCSNLTSITFIGTIAEWNAITKDIDWNCNMEDYTITCTDGTLDKSGNII